MHYMLISICYIVYQYYLTRYHSIHDVENQLFPKQILISENVKS